MSARLIRGASVESEPTWRCPECHTVQARAERCWRCSRSVHSCRTCALFQPSVAADVGTCADDPTGPLVSANEGRACWRSSRTTPVPRGGPQLGGLFSELEPVTTVASVEQPQPVRRGRSLRGAPDGVVRNGSVLSPRPAQPHLEDAGRAAWVEPDGDRLMDAPAVDPGKRLTNEVRRPRRRWFR